MKRSVRSPRYTKSVINSPLKSVRSPDRIRALPEQQKAKYTAKDHKENVGMIHKLFTCEEMRIFLNRARREVPTKTKKGELVEYVYTYVLEHAGIIKGQENKSGYFTVGASKIAPKDEAIYTKFFERLISKGLLDTAPPSKTAVANFFKGEDNLRYRVGYNIFRDIALETLAIEKSCENKPDENGKCEEGQIKVHGCCLNTEDIEDFWHKITTKDIEGLQLNKTQNFVLFNLVREARSIDRNVKIGDTGINERAANFITSTAKITKHTMVRNLKKEFSAIFRSLGINEEEDDCEDIISKDDDLKKIKEIVEKGVDVHKEEGEDVDSNKFGFYTIMKLLWSGAKAIGGRIAESVFWVGKMSMKLFKFILISLASLARKIFSQVTFENGKWVVVKTFSYAASLANFVMSQPVAAKAILITIAMFRDELCSKFGELVSNGSMLETIKDWYSNSNTREEINQKFMEHKQQIIEQTEFGAIWNNIHGKMSGVAETVKYYGEYAYKFSATSIIETLCDFEFLKENASTLFNLISVSVATASTVFGPVGPVLTFVGSVVIKTIVTSLDKSLRETAQIMIFRMHMLDNWDLFLSIIDLGKCSDQFNKGRDAEIQQQVDEFIERDQQIKEHRKKIADEGYIQYLNVKDAALLLKTSINSGSESIGKTFSLFNILGSAE
jgi:hypothetical protein